MIDSFREPPRHKDTKTVAVKNQSFRQSLFDRELFLFVEYPTLMPVMRQYTGGCHCGLVRFRVEAESHEALDCNCSICSKKGFIHLIVPKERFTLLQGEDALTVYRFNTKVAAHSFCKACGIHAFYVPRSHPDGIDVNVRCLDDDAITQFKIAPFDGRHWESNVEQIR